ncbi:hypothetical protein K3H35_18855 [Aeromonas veronii]|uniref:hypothetical protein n=1 Tax=Aeromonas veronii TaxID=654 RepID=UPI001F38978A|nr:hypothetical protein [Aeromonas veronii]MCF5910835.1 hypothetical protein [Aeromonas veronii]
MTFYVRKISKNKWKSCINIPLEEYNSDAITGCTRTNQKKLSVWRTESADIRQEHNAKILLALATTMDSPGKIEVLLIPEDRVEGVLPLTHEPAKTLINEINSYHSDISDLTYKGLGVVSSIIVDVLNEHEEGKRVLFHELTLIEVLSLLYRRFGEEYKTVGLSDRVVKEIDKKREAIIKYIQLQDQQKV